MPDFRAIQRPFRFQAGTAATLTLTVVDTDGDPVDVTGHTLSVTGDATTVAAATADVAAGVRAFTFTGAQTSAIMSLGFGARASLRDGDGDEWLVGPVTSDRSGTSAQADELNITYGPTNLTLTLTAAIGAAQVAAAVDALVDGAPGALDTLNELAAALGNDDAFAATVTAALAGKATPADIAAAIGAHSAATDPHGDRAYTDAQIAGLTPGGSSVVFDVTAYGAVGDGATDDTEAFEDALVDASAAGGGVVFAPVGVYRLRRTIRVGTGVTLQGQGPGTVLTKSAVSAVATVTGVHNAGSTVIDVASSAGFAVGDQVLTYDTTSAEWSATQARVAATTGTSITLDTPLTAQVRSDRSGKVWACFPLVSNTADGSEGGRICDLTLDQQATGVDISTDFTVAAIHFVGAYRYTVERVVFRRCVGDAYSDQAQPGFGLNVTYPQPATILRSTKNRIAGCRIIGPGRHGVHLGTAMDGAIVEGNEISGISNPLGMALFFCAYACNAVVTGNYVRNCMQGFAGGDNRDTGNVISGNVFVGGTNSQQSTSLYAIDGGAQWTITGNIILDWRGGIRIGNGCADAVISGNYVRLSTNGTRECLNVLTGADRPTITGNQFVGGTAGSKAVSLVSVSDVLAVGNLTHDVREGWSLSGVNRATIHSSPVTSAIVGVGFRFVTSTSTDVQLDVRGMAIATPVQEDFAATRLVVNGTGDNGANNPATAGAWNSVPAQRRFNGIDVYWNDGTPHISRYRAGIGWIQLA